MGKPRKQGIKRLYIPNAKADRQYRSKIREKHPFSRQLRKPEQKVSPMEYTCHLCGTPTNNVEQIGTVYVHFCDDCNEQIRREVAWEAQGRTYGEYNVICPYCRYQMDRTDVALLEDGDTPEWECECCHRKFDIEVATVRVYSTKRSICEMPADWQASEEEE